MWEAGSNIALISSNLRSHLVKQGETVKYKARTTGCSLEDSLGRRKSILANMNYGFRPGHQGSHRLSLPGCFHMQLGKAYVTWSPDSLEIIFKVLTTFTFWKGHAKKYHEYTSPEILWSINLLLICDSSSLTVNGKHNTEHPPNFWLWCLSL